MKKLKVFETFSGIGAQHQALENLKQKNILDYEIVGTSDWDVYAVQSYAAIHYPGYEKKFPNPTTSELKKFIDQQVFSVNGKEPLNHLKTGRFKEETYTQWYKAYKAAKNVGSIVTSFPRVASEILEKEGKIDLLTYSFPCQDLSSAGNFHGFNEGIKENTRSGLLLEIEYLLNELKEHHLDGKKVVRNVKGKEKNLLPKYLLLENVLNLVQSKHMPDFKKWLEKLEKLGYKTIWGKLNSHDYGLLQARRRVFALSIYDPKNEIDWSIRDDFDDVLKEINYKPKYQQKNKITEVFDFENKYIEESLLSQMKETPSRIKMRDLGMSISKDGIEKIATITTKQDRWPNAGYVSFNNKRFDDNGVPYLNERFITPREAYKLMGFNDTAFNRAKKKMEEVAYSKVSARDKLYKQAGNSIAVNVLEAIFNYIAKGEF